MNYMIKNISLIFIVLFSIGPLKAQINKTSTVNVSLQFPSDGMMPDMIIFLKEANTGKKYTKFNGVNQNKVSFRNIPKGAYYAYAYVLENNRITDLGGGYTYAVPCGLDVNCNDHNLIKFPVRSGEIVNNIKVFDWYGANLPEE